MIQKQCLMMAKHGAIVTFIGALAGLSYTLVITGDIPGSIRAWHLAHLQGLMTGMLIMIVSSFVIHLNLDSKKRLILIYSFLTTGYCYAFGPIWGAVLGVRGVEPVAPLSNILFFITNTIASISILIGLGLTIYGFIKAKA